MPSSWGRGSRAGYELARAVIALSQTRVMRWQGQITKRHRTSFLSVLKTRLAFNISLNALAARSETSPFDPGPVRIMRRAC